LHVFDGQLSLPLSGQEIGVFVVSVVEGGKRVRPSTALGSRNSLSGLREISIDIVGRASENSDLLHEGLQGLSMCGISRSLGAIRSGAIDGGVLVLSHLLDPDVDRLLQSSSGKVTKQGILSKLLSPIGVCLIIGPIDHTGLEFDTLAELFSQPVEFVGSGKGAQDDEDFLPFGQIGVLHNVRQVFGNDRLEQSKVRKSCGTLLKVGLLGLGQEIGTASNGEH
jgi:hypothetical protein